VLLGGGHDLEPDPVRARHQQRFASAGAEQQLPFGVGQVERGGDRVDGLGCLAHQDLGGAVGDDGLPQIGAEDVGGVLGDDREAGVAFCGRLWPS